MRVANIRNNLNLKNLYHIDGKHNVADFGTRGDFVTADLLRPGNYWLNGKEWMKMSVEKAQSEGIIKSSQDIILDNDAKKKLREGTIHNEFDDPHVSNYVANTIDVKKESRTKSPRTKSPRTKSLKKPSDHLP